MDERLVKKLLLPSFIIVILSTAFLYELKHVVDLLIFKEKHLLIIGILSSPENFEKRQTIRNTWLKLLPDVSGSSYFIIGNEICDVPPLDRADPYSCVDKPFTLPKSATAETEFLTIKEQKGLTAVSSNTFTGFSFYVRRNIVIKKLGIKKSLLKVFKDKLQVKLKSLIDNKVLASVTFSADFYNETGSELLSKKIKPVLLKKEYEASVKLEMAKNNLLPPCEYSNWENEPNVINFIQLWEEGSNMPQPFTMKSCTYVFIVYTVENVMEIKDHISKKNLRIKDWNKTTKELSQKLSNESKTFKDIVFVHVIDVYRNLSLKMVKFYKKITETEYFHYVLKTDDDSFIDLLRVHNHLKEINKEIDSEINKIMGQSKETGIVAKIRLSKFWWWTYFKEYWKVQRAGKWRDDNYKSVCYPIFPCGGGYVINKGIVNYIVSNEHSLNHFQGEDVSMGIWMSSLSTTDYKVPKTEFKNYSNSLQEDTVQKFVGKKEGEPLKNFVPKICEWTCDNNRNYNLPFCNKVQLSMQDMYDTWKEYNINGFI